MADVIYEKDGHIARITLNRPDSLNAYRRQMLQELETIWADVNSDDDVWVVILTGAGRGFCAGADMKAPPEDTTDGIPRFDDYENAIEVVKPIIAAVNGHAYGGGLNFAIACDIRIAAEEAVFAESQVKRGKIGPQSTRHLMDILPRAAAMEMILTGDPINAQEAYRIGLVNAVVPRTELMDAANAMAERICRNAPLAVWASKESALGLSTRHGYRESADIEEGRRAFAEKRNAEFEGR